MEKGTIILVYGRITPVERVTHRVSVCSGAQVQVKTGIIGVYRRRRTRTDVVAVKRRRHVVICCRRAIDIERTA